MKPLITSFIIVLYVISSGCINQKTQSVPGTGEKKLTAIDFYSILSFTGVAGEEMPLIDEMESVYFYDDMIMYQLPVYSFHTSGTIENGILQTPSDSGLIASYTYVLFKENQDSTGFLYATLNGPIRDTVSVNSFMANGFRNFGDIFKKTSKYHVLIGSKKNRDSMMEIYAPRVKPNNTFSDTTYLFYREDYNDVKYSLVSDLDSTKKMKLFKVIALFNADPHSNDPVSQQAKKMRLEIRKKVIENPEAIKSLFKRFEENHLSYKSRSRQ